MLGWPALAKIVRVAKRENVTSIADILGARYGRSRAVAVIATLIAVVGAMPYIALQLQAVSSSFRTIAASESWVDGQPGGVVHTDTSLIVAALMALFTLALIVQVLDNLCKAGNIPATLVVENAPALDLMSALKRTLDPKGILNPGKIFAD